MTVQGDDEDQNATSPEAGAAAASAAALDAAESREAPPNITEVVPSARTVRVYPPGKDETIVDVLDADGNIIESGVGKTEDDALLGIIEKLRYHVDE